MTSVLSLQVILALLLGAFLFAESIGAIWKITHHDRPLHATKYLFTAFVGFWLCVNALVWETTWLEIAEAAALSAFVARRLLWRFGHRIADIHVAHQKH